MSIETEFESTITNVKNAYQGLDNLGATIPQNKTIENIKSCLDEIYNKFPKTSYAEGSDITLSNTLKGKLDFEDEDGKKKIGFAQTEQKSTEGKNVFEPVLSVDGTDIVRAGVSNISVSNGEYTLVANATDMFFGQITANGSTYTNNRGVKIYKNGNEKISYKISSSEINRMFITAYDSNGTSLGYVEKTGSSQGTYTFPTNCDFITFRIGRGNAVSGTTYKFNVMVAYGDTIPTYEPYTGGIPSPNPSYPQDIEVVTGTQEVVERGINYANYSLLFNNTDCYSISNDNISLLQNDSRATTLIDGTTWGISLKKGTYTLYTSGTGISPQIQIIGKAIGQITRVNYNQLVTFELSQDDIVAIKYLNTSTFPINLGKVMIIKGTITNVPTYEPYQTPQTYQLSLGEYEFAKIGNYVDTIEYDVDEDKVYKNERFKKIDLSTIASFTHTSGWANQTAFVAYNVITHGISGYATVADILCNRLIKDTPEHIASSVTNAIGLGDNANMFLSIEGLTTSSDYVNYFDNNPTYLYAPLATPIKTEITGTLKDQIKALYYSQSFNGTTIIEINGQLPLIIKVRALKGE